MSFVQSVFVDFTKMVAPEEIKSYKDLITIAMWARPIPFDPMEIAITLLALLNQKMCDLILSASSGIH
jgi:hypothetical protein